MNMNEEPIAEVKDDPIVPDNQPKPPKPPKPTKPRP
jgi:hypothetical protein